MLVPGTPPIREVGRLIPNAALFGVLWDPAFPASQFLIPDLHAAARTLSLQLAVVSASTDSDLETAFESFSQQLAGAVLVTGSTFNNPRTEQLAALAARHALFPYREFALAGGLVGYGSSIGYLYRQAGIYTGRILKGEKPADLPVQQVTRLELIINLKCRLNLPIASPSVASALCAGYGRDIALQRSPVCGCSRRQVYERL
jgi:putative tryptophan/tyrosine transport system substrate-binding protein